MRVAVVGSRNFPRPDLVREFIQKLAARDPQVIIVSGGAKGVDSWAAVAAQEAGLGVVVYPADWATHGKTAGFLRNTTIVENSDRCVAFWDGRSHGTQDTVSKFKKAGKPVQVVTVTT